MALITHDHQGAFQYNNSIFAPVNSLGLIRVSNTHPPISFATSGSVPERIHLAPTSCLFPPRCAKQMRIEPLGPLPTSRLASYLSRTSITPSKRSNRKKPYRSQLVQIGFLCKKKVPDISSTIRRCFFFPFDVSRSGAARSIYHPG